MEHLISCLNIQYNCSYITSKLSIMLCHVRLANLNPRYPQETSVIFFPVMEKNINEASKFEAILHEGT